MTYLLECEIVGGSVVYPPVTKKHINNRVKVHPCIVYPKDGIFKTLALSAILFGEDGGTPFEATMPSKFLKLNDDEYADLELDPALEPTSIFSRNFQRVVLRCEADAGDPVLNPSDLTVVGFSALF